jgi:hypothetical protein
VNGPTSHVLSDIISLPTTCFHDDIYISGDPAGLTIDFAARRIYWTDSALHKIEMSNFDGTDRRQIVSGLQNPFKLALVSLLDFNSVSCV